MLIIRALILGDNTILAYKTGTYSVHVAILCLLSCDTRYIYHIMLSTQHPLTSSSLNTTTTMDTTMDTTMRAALYNATPYHVTTTTLPIPVLDPTNHTSALLRITTSAICGSDLHVYHGLQGNNNPPWVMGHEAVGVVEDVGDAVEALAVGDYVIVPDQVASGRLEMEAVGDLGFGAGDHGLGGLQGILFLSPPPYSL